MLRQFCVGDRLGERCGMGILKLTTFSTPTNLYISPSHARNTRGNSISRVRGESLVRGYICTREVLYSLYLLSALISLDSVSYRLYDTRDDTCMALNPFTRMRDYVASAVR